MTYKVRNFCFQNIAFSINTSLTTLLLLYLSTINNSSSITYMNLIKISSWCYKNNFDKLVYKDLKCPTMETTGSKSLSPGTSIHVISTAPGSPGEQGVSRSFTMQLGSALEGPRTCNHSNLNLSE